MENLEFDYPVYVDVNTFKETEDQPDKQYIGWPTHATESFRAHRVIDGVVDTALVAVKAGAKVEVGVMVEVKAETAKNKLGHNSAG